MSAVKTVGLVINSYKEQIIEIGKKLTELLHQQQVAVVAIGEEAEALQILPSTEEEFCQAAQIVLVIGGDGTMLRAARTVYGKEIPLLGINQGSR